MRFYVLEQHGYLKLVFNVLFSNCLHASAFRMIFSQGFREVFLSESCPCSLWGKCEEITSLGNKIPKSPRGSLCLSESDQKLKKKNKRKAFPGLQTHLLCMANGSKVLSSWFGTWAQVVQRAAGHWGLAQCLAQCFGSCSLLLGGGTEGLQQRGAVALHGDVEGQVESLCFLPERVKTFQK